MKQLSVSHHFQKLLKKLPPDDREKTVQKLKEFLSFLQSGQIPQGYGFKKINGDKYELRVDIKIRVVMQSDEDTLVCHVVGNHEDVRRYLKNFR